MPKAASKAAGRRQTKGQLIWKAQPRDGVNYKNVMAPSLSRQGLEELEEEEDGAAEGELVEQSDPEQVLNGDAIDAKGKRVAGNAQVGSKGRRKAKRVDFGRLDNNEVETPDNVLDEIRAEFGQFFDPCPFVGKNRQPDFNGLSPTECAWQEFNYVNPPYDFIDPWMKRAADEMALGHTTVMLIPARTGSVYWHELAWPICTEIRFISGQVFFKGYAVPSPHHLSLLIYRSEPERLRQHANTHWPLLEILDSQPELKRRFPQLYSIASKAHPPQGTFAQQVLPWQWMLELCTGKQLAERLSPDAPRTDLTSTVVLPLFAQMVLVLQAGGRLRTLAHQSTRAFALPELLRRLASDFAQNPEIQQWATRLELAQLWESVALSFYEAFMENAQMHHQNACMQRTIRMSPDNEYTTICIPWRN